MTDTAASTGDAFIERVATAVANQPAYNPARLLLTLIAAPFYLIGFLLGMIYVIIMFIVGAIRVGIADARKRATIKPLPPKVEP